MLFEPGHDLDEIAGHVAIVELMDEDAVPAVPAGAGTARKGEEIGSPATPAQARDWMVEVRIFSHEIMWKATAKPSISFS